MIDAQERRKFELSEIRKMQIFFGFINSNLNKKWPGQIIGQLKASPKKTGEWRDF